MLYSHHSPNSRNRRSTFLFYLTSPPAPKKHALNSSFTAFFLVFVAKVQFKAHSCGKRARGAKSAGGALSRHGAPLLHFFRKTFRTQCSPGTIVPTYFENSATPLIAMVHDNTKPHRNDLQTKRNRLKSRLTHNGRHRYTFFSVIDGYTK